MSARAELAPSLAKRSSLIRPWTRFPGVEQIDASAQRLAEQAPDAVRMETIGTTRAGHPLRMLDVGTGTRHAVVIGMTHPNEPTGAAAALRLAELLAADRALRAALGLAWHIVPCSDPDGTRLNEAWFAGPYDRLTYAQHFYRPPFAEQVEWTFRMDDREPAGLTPLPETRALMELIDAYEPELLVSLHNAEAGGLFCYVTRAVPSLIDGMAVVREASGLPGHQGGPDAQAELLGPGVFGAAPALDGAPMLCSTDYAARHGAFGLTTEPPLWTDVRLDDPRLTVETRRQVADRHAHHRRELAAEHAAWIGALDGRLGLTTPLHRAVQDDARNLSGALDGPDVLAAGEDERSSVAYRSWLDEDLHLERLRAAGHLSGALRVELDARNDDDAILAVLSHVEQRMTSWAAEAGTSSASFVGLRAAVQAHVGLTLAAAGALA